MLQLFYSVDEVKRAFTRSSFYFLLIYFHRNISPTIFTKISPNFHQLFSTNRFHPTSLLQVFSSKYFYLWKKLGEGLQEAPWIFLWSILIEIFSPPIFTQLFSTNTFHPNGLLQIYFLQIFCFVEEARRGFTAASLNFLLIYFNRNIFTHRYSPNCFQKIIFIQLVFFFFKYFPPNIFICGRS